MKALALMLACWLAASSAEALEAVRFPSSDGSLITGWLARPSGAGPFPAVVGLHGCAGLWRRNALAAREQAWSDHLTGAGFIVLFPDSYRSRGLKQVCTETDRAIRPRGRAGDALGAMDWLAAQSFVDRRRIGLLGWSNGASTVLYAVREGVSPDRTDFRAAVAFYPGCTVPLRLELLPRVPLTIFHGEADDWTPIGPCRNYAARTGASFVAYPDAFHDFDSPDMPVHERRGIATAKRLDGRVTLGTNTAARDDALARVVAIFGSM